MILLLDNHDSFTFNLAQYLGELGAEVKVVFSDAIDVPAIRALGPSHLVISPGPCTPAEAGVSVDAVRAFAGTLPILGVCLGHQAIAVAYGARVLRAARPVHGKVRPIRHDGLGLFAGLSSPLAGTRYHSLVVDPASLPDELLACAWSDEDEPSPLMALRHRTLPVHGLQFHPESIGTPEGKRLLERFLAPARE